MSIEPEEPNTLQQSSLEISWSKISKFIPLAALLISLFTGFISWQNYQVSFPPNIQLNSIE
jgi:hypothetical protein